MDFPFSCTIEPPLTENEYHSVSYGTPVTSECNYKEVLEFDFSKNIEVRSAWLALPPGTNIQPISRVTLDNGNTYNAAPNVQNVKRLSDNEIEFVRVLLGAPLKG